MLYFFLSSFVCNHFYYKIIFVFFYFIFSFICADSETESFYSRGKCNKVTLHLAISPTHVISFTFVFVFVFHLTPLLLYSLIATPSLIIVICSRMHLFIVFVTFLFFFSSLFTYVFYLQNFSSWSKVLLLLYNNIHRSCYLDWNHHPVKDR